MRGSSYTRLILILNFIVFIWGMTGVLGKLIELSSPAIVFYRTLITIGAILVYLFWKGWKIILPWKRILILLGAGALLGIHWLLFFHAIKLSNVSVTLTMLSSGALFVSFIEPLFYRRGIRLYEVFFGLLAVSGVYIIYGVNIEYKKGIIVALIAALFSALFSVVNSKLVRRNSSAVITFYEMIGAFLVSVIVFVAAQDGFVENLAAVTWRDFVFLLILGVLCTAYTQIVTVRLMKRLTPYTVMLNVNLEPVYSIAIAVMIWPQSEIMPSRFYMGGGIILLTVLSNVLLKMYREKRKVRSAEKELNYYGKKSQ